MVKRVLLLDIYFLLALTVGLGNLATHGPSPHAPHAPHAVAWRTKNRDGGRETWVGLWVDEGCFLCMSYFW